MKIEMFLNFKTMPTGTAQLKGERIKYKFQDGRKVPYIDHYRKTEVQAARNQFTIAMKPYRPKQPSDHPIKLTVLLCFDIKRPKKLWGTYKTTRPDCDNYVKEIKDVMTELKFWNDDAQVVDLRVIKRYAEKATIYICMDEIDESQDIKGVVT